MHRRTCLQLLIAALLACRPAIAPAAHADAPANERAGARKARGVTDKPYGRPGDARKVKRIIAVDMSDTMQFFPSSIRVKRGDTVRFDIRNGGQLPHEMVIGTMDELRQHAALMKKHPDMNHGNHRNHGTHREPHASHVLPGARARLVWQFTKPGEFHYACLVPGHFDAGMIGTIVVR